MTGMPRESTPLLRQHHHDDQQGCENGSPSRRTRRMSDDLDPSHSYLPLSLQCFVTGLADAIAYTVAQTWVAFMTGNLTQLALSLVSTARYLVLPNNYNHRKEDESHRRLILSTSAVLGFCLGSYLSSAFSSGWPRQRGRPHVRPRWSPLTRGRLVCLSLIHAIITLGVLATAWRWRSQDVPANEVLSPPLLAALAATMGSQSIASLQLGSHPFSTTVVFTSSLSSLVGDITHFPWAFVPTLGETALESATANARKTTRYRGLSILMLLVGAAVGGTLIELAAGKGGDEEVIPQSASIQAAEVSDPGTRMVLVPLLVLCCAHLLTAAAWWSVRGEQPKHEDDEAD